MGTDTRITNPDILVRAAARLHKLKLLECFDPINVSSTPTPAQLAVMQDAGSVTARFVTAGNQSGKSQLAAREIAWVLTETHPYWSRSERTGQDKLQILVLGRVQKQIEEVLWRKIKGFLNPEDIKEQRSGGALQSITYKPNGNKIIFLSHHNINEAREKAQAYTADWVWLDELPSSVKLIEELQRRIQARDGRFLSTFTPKTPNKEIKELIDNSKKPWSAKYQFAMLDNPIYSDKDKEKILHDLETLPEAYKRTILYGDWYSGDNSVYQITEDMVEAPENYSTAWRHVEAADPALSSKFGVTVWAENPFTGVWYCVRSEEIPGVKDPLEMFEKAQLVTQGLNIIKRICDPEANWYTGLALSKNIIYQLPNKHNRKGDLIKNLQIALTEGRIKIAPWCDIVLRQLESCQWSSLTDGKIVNSSSYHALDTCQYFVDMMPAREKRPPVQNWYEHLRSENDKRKKNEARKGALLAGGRRKWILRRS